MASSIRAQKIAEELLGLDSRSMMPSGSMYGGAMDSVGEFYRKNKKMIWIVGGAAVVGAAGYMIYKKMNQ